MNKCKNCNSENLTFIENYNYQFEDEPFELIDCYQCDVCKCIHWEDEHKKYWEFHANAKEFVSNVNDWKI